MLLYDVAAAWVAGVNDVVSLLGSLSFHFRFLHVPNLQFWVKTLFLNSRLVPADWTSTIWVSVVGTVITKIRLVC